MISCEFIHQHEFGSDIYPNHRICFRGETELIYTDISCSSDIPESGTVPAEVMCLLIGATKTPHETAWDRSKSGQYIVQFAVVLQSCTSEAVGLFQRIGMFEHDSRKGWFREAPVRSVEII
jgi:hypothetical protein